MVAGDGALIDRRTFFASAALLGLDAVWAGRLTDSPHPAWTERRALYPEGVASGDPDENSVILWTRREFAGRENGRLAVEVSEDERFSRVVARHWLRVERIADWTCRVAVGGLRPDTVYWYRFVGEAGHGSRIGRTITAPRQSDRRAVRFAFVSCQNVNQGAQNAFRKMIHEDELAAPSERLGFVLHLGDFIYEVVWYPEDRPQGMLDRRLRDVVRYPSGEKIRDFHIPTTVEDYRAVYKAYLHDPDIQDARARWPFVAMWDNHEFSQNGWQSVQEFGGSIKPLPTRKVAANQAWYDYQPARVGRPGGLSLKRFDPPKVIDSPITRFDDAGLGLEANNLAAINSLTGYRAFRWGQHVELLITDQHSYRSRDPMTADEAAVFSSDAFLDMVPEEAMVVLDAGRAYDDGKPPVSLRFGDRDVPNFRRTDPPQTILGATQKAWLLDQLASSKATWKLWGNTQGTLDWRADPQNLPSGVGLRWPGQGYAGFGGGDHGACYVERAEIYDYVRSKGITGFATLAGDRHSFWAGLSAKALPPSKFEPVGVAFVVASICAPGLVEAEEHRLSKTHPLRALYLADLPGRSRPEPSINLLLRHGVKTCLEYAATGDLDRALKVRNADLSPHLSFLDLGGHGYAVVEAGPDRLDVEFVCIPRPLEWAETPDGGPLRYRVMHSVDLWEAGSTPLLTNRVLEGDVGLSA